MSIWGIHDPRFIPASGTINFDFVTVIKDEAVFRRNVDESELNGDRNIISKGYHWIFQFDHHLHEESVPLTFYNTLEAELFSEGDLHRDRAKNAFKDSGGIVVPFQLVAIDRLLVTTAGFEDVLRLTFLSTKFVDISKST